MIKKILPFIILASSALFGVDIPTDIAKERMFGKKVEVNSQITQLSNSKQSVMSMVGGHIEKYYVKQAQVVKKGDKLALIESIKLSNMTAQYISLKEQYKALDKNYKSVKKLYNKGMTSLQEFNNQTIKKDAMLSKINSLSSQLHTLGIDTNKLKKASANYILYAHSSGRVSDILQAVHSVVDPQTPILTIVKKDAYYLKSYIPLEYASKIKLNQKVVATYNDQVLVTHITQIMPEVDTTTQRIIALSMIDSKSTNLFLNAYLGSTIYFDQSLSYVSVKKSALSFYNNEWVVFVPKEEDHDEHEDEDHDEHESGEHEDEEHEEGAHHGEHEESEAPYEIKVVDIITQDEKYVAVKGLNSGDKYVSGKSYFVKSMLLKSSLGEHGH